MTSLIGSYILIIFISTSSSSQSGAASISQEFSTHLACANAGKGLTEQAHSRGNFVLTWGCFPKKQLTVEIN